MGAHLYAEEPLCSPISSSSRVRDIVLDPSIVSGTTAVVAKKFGRRFLGCDINREYVEIAKNRSKKC
ncbi:MAG: site-specific DNA-methyltransferase [Thaumarchaeota archaeon]|nr:site-specific DNA-methyltransferase [Nitrososphaerota archaeon]